MAKFLYLYRGGNVPEELRDQNMKDWMNWIEKLQTAGKMTQAGAPLNTGKVVHSDGSATDFTWEGNDSGVGGWSQVEAADIDEAVSLTAGCPQLDSRYGGGTVEVRPILEIPGM